MGKIVIFLISNQFNKFALPLHRYSAELEMVNEAISASFASEHKLFWRFIYNP